jgi:hypothetical protein
LRAGESFRKEIGHGLAFYIQPDKMGWLLEVGPAAAGGDFVGCVTPPFHGPNVAHIFAWHFVSRDNAALRPLETNELGNPRDFQFVLNTADQDKACKELDVLLHSPPQRDPRTGDIVLGTLGYREPPLGNGSFQITDIKIGNLGPAKEAVIERLSFEARFTFPEPAKPAKKRR